MPLFTHQRLLIVCTYISVMRRQGRLRNNGNGSTMFVANLVQQAGRPCPGFLVSYPPQIDNPFSLHQQHICARQSFLTIHEGNPYPNPHCGLLAEAADANTQASHKQNTLCVTRYARCNIYNGKVEYTSTIHEVMFAFEIEVRLYAGRFFVGQLRRSHEMLAYRRASC